MANQQFKDYITTRTEDTAPDIAADFLPIYDASATTTKKVTPTSLRTRMFASGSIDGGGLTSFEIPNSAAPTVDADGEIAVDTSVADFSHGIVKVFAGEELALVALPIAELTTPTGGHVIAYNATNDEFELVAPSGGGIGGSTGSTDNAILRADGTGGATAQSSSATINDSGVLTVTHPSSSISFAIEPGASSGLVLFRDAGNTTQVSFQNGNGLVQALLLDISGNASTTKALATAYNASDVPLAAKMAATPTANAFEVRNSSNTVVTAFDATGAWEPPSMADSSAPNNSVYYSTTASKLVYKDSGGTVNNLY